jgi:hypothetical protein
MLDGNDSPWLANLMHLKKQSSDANRTLVEKQTTSAAPGPRRQRPLHRQPVRLHVALLLGVRLDPLEPRPRPATLARAHAPQQLLDEVPILDRLPRGRDPAARGPAGAPLGHALDRVRAVRVHRRVAVERHHVQRALDGRQLGALVGLARARERLGDVAGRR